MSRQVVLVRNARQLQWLAANQPAHIENALLVALNFGTYHQLHREGWRVRPFWAYFPDETRQRVPCDVRAFLDDACPALLEGTGLEGMREAVAHDLMLFLHEAIAGAGMVRRLIVTERPESMVVLSDRRLPCVERVGGTQSDVLEGIAMFVGEREGISCVCLPDPCQPRIEGRLSTARRVGQAVERLGHHAKCCAGRWGGRLAAWAGRARARRSRRPLALALLSQQEMHRHFELVNRLAAAANWEIEQVDNESWFHSINAYSSWRDARWRQVYRRAWNRFDENRKREIKWPEVVANPHLDFQWRHLLRQAAYASVCYAGIARRIHRFLRPRGVLFSLHNASVNGVLIRYFRSQGITTILLAHSGWFNTEFREFLYADWYVAPGEVYRRILTRNGVSETRVLMAGNPRLDAVPFPERPPCSALAADTLRCRRKEAPPARRERVALVVTGDFHACGVFPKFFQPSPGEMYSAFLELVRAPAEIENLRVIIKPHPSIDYYSFYDQLAGGNVVHLRHGSLTELARGADVIVGIGVHTTGLFECMACGKPLLFCAAGAKQEVLTELERAGCLVGNVTQLVPALRRILDDGRWCQALAAKGAAFLETMSRREPLTELCWATSSG